MDQGATKDFRGFRDYKVW
jgi:hypothetical protein